MTDNVEVKLYAGKFKSIEDLENGYKASLPAFQEAEQLKKQLSEVTAIPDTYLNPTDIDLDPHRLTDIQLRAKEASMTQAQYEKFLRGDKSRVEQHKQNFEKAKKEMGEEQLNLIQDYVGKNYPKEIAENLINTAITNKTVRDALLNHRQQVLSNQVPGVGKVTPNSYHVSDDDVRKAYTQKEKTKSVKDITHYMNLINQQALQRQAS